jgi:protein SMG5
LKNRGVIEIATELESVISDANSLTHMFTDVVINSRQRLKDECELILYSAPLEFGRKAEEILWRRCYHDLMQYYKRHKKVYNYTIIYFIETLFTFES